MALTSRLRGFPRAGTLDPHLCDTLAIFVMVTALVAGAGGLLVSESPGAAGAVVQGLAWVKGESLDVQLYGIPRAVSWAARVKRLGAFIGPPGIVLGVSILVLRRLKDPRRGFLRGMAFLAAFAALFGLRDFLSLPFSNPWEIVGALSEAGRNPASDTLQFFVIVLGTALAVGLVDMMGRGSARGRALEAARLPEFSGAQKAVLLAFAAALVLLVAGDAYTWHEQVPLDTFHEGESLGPAVQWEHGGAPYRDIVIVHGPFHDPIRSVLAFSVFGRSIASARTMASILEIVAVLLFGVLVFQLFRWEPAGGALAAGVLFFFAGSKPFGAGFTIPHRDITVCLFLFSVVPLHRLLAGDDPAARRPKTLFLLFAASAVPIASFAYSVDRGLFLTVGAVVAVALHQIAVGTRWTLRSASAIGAGLLAGLFFVGLSIRWAFPEFLTHVFRVLPEVHGLGFSLPYPFADFPALVPLLLAAFNASWLAHRCVLQCRGSGSVGEGIREWVRTLFVELLLFALGLLFYRSALGRAGLDHIHYSGGLTFLLTALILVRHLGAGTLARLARPSGGRFAAALAGFLIIVGMSLAAGMNLSLWYRFPLGAPDEDAIDPNYRAAIGYLRDSVRTSAPFLTLTSEGVWEYFIGRPAPSRFAIVVYALPAFYQDELIDDIEKHRVEYILYRSSHWANNLDGIPLERRLPRVVRHVRERYEPHRVFEDQELWRRKGDATACNAPQPAH